MLFIHKDNNHLPMFEDIYLLIFSQNNPTVYLNNQILDHYVQQILQYRYLLQPVLQNAELTQLFEIAILEHD